MDSGEARRRGEQGKDAEGADWPPLPPGLPVHPPARQGPLARQSSPPRPYAPPRPTAPPPAVWLRLPRPAAGPGIWRCGHRPRDETPTTRLAGVALSTASAGILLFALMWTGRLGDLWIRPVAWIPDSGWQGTGGTFAVALVYAYYALIAAIIVAVCAWAGRWGDLLRRVSGARHGPAPQSSPPRHEDPAGWPELRAAGAVEAADLLTAELESGAMSDVDHARITHAWRVRDAQRPDATDAFVQEITARGAAAYPHHSGARDLPARTAEHDLLLRQVRIGTAVDSAYNPYVFRTAGIALDPSVLGTSALAVGPSGAGKTGGLVRPVVESLCLQALAGQAAVVLVTSDTDAPLPEEAFDIVLRPEDPASPYSLDLYGTDDPDAAADVLADALLGDPAAAPGGGDHRAATVLAQLTGPFKRVHGRLPGVPDLRDLLDGDDDALRELRSALAHGADGGAYDEACLRGLDALLVRRPAGPRDVRALLADAVALLDRPAFAGLFTPGAAPSAPSAPERRPVPVCEPDRPVRIRFDLPERRHPQASRILARLLLGQFTRSAAARRDRDLFTFLVLDDAAQAVTARTLQSLRRLRSAHAGTLLTLRSLTGDVPAHLCRPLLDAVGCRIACARLSPPDARHFAEAWHAEYAHSFTAPRWTESELTHAVPPGYAVLSCTTPHGERTQPLLTALGR